MDKKLMRRLALEKRDSLTIEQRESDSRKIMQRLTDLPCYQKADALLTYVSFRSEADTLPLIRLALQDGKAVFAPRVSGRDMEFFRIFSFDDLKEGYQGILEPDTTHSYTDLVSQNALLCIPGAAFDKKRHRIGYGGGFYDRYLSGMEESRMEKTIKAAFAFSCQIFEEIPWEFHDICPDFIITEREIIV